MDQQSVLNLKPLPKQGTTSWPWHILLVRVLLGGGRLECELVPQHPLLLSPTTPRKHTAEVVTLERGGVETGLPKVAFVQRIPPQARREVSQQKDERGT
jgi:hypothetical protein